MKDWKKWIAYGSVIVCFLVCSMLVISWIKEERKQAEAVDLYEDLQEEHASVLENVDLSVDEVMIPVDFEALHEVNEDIYAWIDIEDTNVH